MESPQKFNYTSRTKTYYSQGMMLRLLTFSVILACFGCQNVQDMGGDAGLPEATGDFAEIIVLTDPGTKADIKSSLNDAIAFPAAGLPPPEEPVLKLRFTDQNFLKGFFKKHFQMLAVIHRGNWNLFSEYFDAERNSKINSALASGKPTLLTLKNVWAKPQLMHLLIAPDVKSLNEYILNYKDALYQVIHKGGTDLGIQKIYGKNLYKDSLFVQQFNTRGYGIAKPASVRIAALRDDFLWLRKGGSKYDLGIFMYEEPYTGEQQFSADYIVKLRNKMTGKYILGQLDSTFMQVEPQFPVVSDTIEFNGMYTVKTSGWWKLENDFMGGPFVSYTILSPKRDKIITIEGNVYAPNQPKVKYLRETEIMLSTFKIK